MAELIGANALKARFRAIGHTDKLVADIIIHAVRDSKLIVPRKTGNLGRTIRAGRISATQGELLAGGRLKVGYARDVELGTKPHVIRPKAGRVGRNGRPAALAWGGGRRLSGALRSGSSPTHFARVVHHPGTKAHPYLIPGLQQAIKERGVSAIAELWNRAA